MYMYLFLFFSEVSFTSWQFSLIRLYKAEPRSIYFVMVGAMQDIWNLTMEMKLINDQQERENFRRIPKILLLLLVVYQLHFDSWIPNVLHCLNHDEIGAPGLSLTKSDPKKLQFTNKISNKNIFFVFQWGILHQSAVFSCQTSWGWARRHLLRHGWSNARHSEFNHGNEIDKRPTRTGEFSKNFQSEFQ